MLPEISGEEVCKIIRAESNIPIIVLSAKDELFSKIELLDLGADDYITKPFVIDELFARMRVIFRNKQEVNNKGILKYGELQLNTNSKEVFFNNNLLKLTKTEYNLLHYMLLNKELVLSREQILLNVWEHHDLEHEKIVDMYIKTLRKKIGPTNKYIKTIRGFGYVLKMEEF